MRGIVDGEQLDELEARLEERSEPAPQDPNAEAAAAVAQAKAVTAAPAIPLIETPAVRGKADAMATHYWFDSIVRDFEEVLVAYQKRAQSEVSRGRLVPPPSVVAEEVAEVAMIIASVKEDR